MQPGIQKGKLKRVKKEKGLVTIQMEKEIIIPEQHFKLRWKALNERLRILQSELTRMKEIAKKANIDLEAK